MSTRVSAQWRERGIAAARAGDKVEARAALEQAVDLDPDDEQAWNDMFLEVTTAAGS